MLRSQEAVLMTMEACEKPANTQCFLEIPKSNKTKMTQLERPGRKVMTHLRCLEDGVNIFAWFMCSENQAEFQETFSDFFGAIDFNGSKLGSEQPPVNKQWYQAFRKVH
mmetsp:Transcript_2654/g.4451  ORF Transcript_2654/g.4451 Transcript_2654/m.4451 type:complete len:109 (+) Transcript_2654:357-683(+)